MWYFGQNAGLSFHTNPPSALTDGLINTDEGCASISDAQGNLLFYTDGITVWDRNHNVMPNGTGLLGDPSSVNSGMIIPNPQYDSIYYLFTLPKEIFGITVGLCYSKIDMSLNGGLGAIVPSEKNVELLKPVGERMTAVKQSNGCDYWLITAAYSTENYYAFSITAAGIDPVPVVTSMGTGAFEYYYGMKASPDAKRIAIAHSSYNVVQVFDFNNATGQLSNPISLPVDFCYGVEFSPDGNVLYTSGESSQEIHQFNLLAGSPAAIAGSDILIGNNYGTLQLGPDGKIYAATSGQSFVGVIENPNTIGLGCNYINNAIPLAGKISKRGFPPFISDYFYHNSILSSQNTCLGDTVYYSIADTALVIDSIRWDFNDPASGAFNTAYNFIPFHIFSTAGTYNVFAILYRECKNDTLKITTTIYSLPEITVAPSLPGICLGDSATLTATGFGTITWSPATGLNATAGTTIMASPPATQQYTITDANGCSQTDSVIVLSVPVTDFTTTNECLSDSVSFTNISLITTPDAIASWAWEFGDGTSPNITMWNAKHLYAIPGNYQVTLIVNSEYGCADTLTAALSIYSLPTADFDFLNVCLNQTMTFTDLSNVTGGTINFWSWNFGDTSPLNINQNTSHLYVNDSTYLVNLSVTDNNGCNDTINKITTVHPLPQSKFVANNVCDGSFAQFNDLSTILNPDNIQGWSWNFSDGAIINNQNTSHLFSAAGPYTVQLTTTSNFGCIDSVSKTFVVNPKPFILFSANDTTGCEPLCLSFQNASFISSGSMGSWLWNFGDGDTATISQDVLHCYYNGATNMPVSFSPTLTAISDSGCVSVLTKENYITVYPAPVALFTASPTITSLTNPTIELLNTSAGGTTWAWDFGDGQTDVDEQPLTHVYSDTGSYLISLIATSQYDCEDTTQQTIIVEPDFIFYIPNAFTPNGDGINDSFIGKGVFIKEFEMLIFDRWGNLIYKSDNIDKPWNGKVEGGKEIAQRDVYVYAVKVTDYKMLEHTYRGTVTLVK